LGYWGRYLNYETRVKTNGGKKKKKEHEGGRERDGKIFSRMN
jgi:hypothetical protein